jgi:glycerol uptake facilitator-like aquaporin
MTAHEFPLRRALAYWVLTFACAYAASLLFYTVYRVVPTGWSLFFLQVVTPLCYLLFGWLYFRREPDNDWHHRIAVAALWIGLSLFGSAVLMGSVYGYPWSAAFSAGNIKGQAINAATVLVAAMIARRGRSA